MGNYPAPPASGLEMAWSSPDGIESSRTTLRWENEAWTVETLLVADRATLVLRISAGWSAQQMLLFRDLDEPDLWLATDGGGRWGEVNGAHRPDLDGATGIVVTAAPALLGIAVRRLPLHVGHSADIREMSVDVDTLSLVTVTTRYTRVDTDRWEFGPLGAASPTQIRVDTFGFPLDVPGTFVRRDPA